MTAFTSATSDLASQTAAASERRLRLVLKLNAATCAASAAIGLVAWSYFADLFEVQAGVVVGLSVGLLLFGGRVAVVASRARRLGQYGRLVAASDLGWVVGTAVVIVADLVSTTGKVVLGLVAVGVLDFALTQLWLARHLD